MLELSHFHLYNYCWPKFFAAFSILCRYEGQTEPCFNSLEISGVIADINSVSLF